MTKRLDTTSQNCCNLETGRGEPLATGQEVPMDITEELLARVLEPLIQYPFLIAIYSEDIADELVERGLFSIAENSVTGCGRDFLTRFRAA